MPQVWFRLRREISSPQFCTCASAFVNGTPDVTASSMNSSWRNAIMPAKSSGKTSVIASGPSILIIIRLSDVSFVDALLLSYTHFGPHILLDNDVNIRHISNTKIPNTSNRFLYFRYL